MVAGRVFESQGARIAVNLLLAGLLSLVLWRLFRTKLDRGAASRPRRRGGLLPPPVACRRRRRLQLGGPYIFSRWESSPTLRSDFLGGFLVLVNTPSGFSRI